MRKVNDLYSAIRVPAAALHKLPPHPRLRRASAISRFAALAGLNAIAEAKEGGLEVPPERTAIIFAISNGGVIYTRRFYQEIVSSGAAAASPILFPETVFNAPASHLAALIGLSGQTYTLVGDGSVGLSALEMADRVLDEEDVDFCLVVAAEEVDWLLCDAYQRWRLTGSAGKMTLSEGAGAVLLTRGASAKVRFDHAAAAMHVERRSCLTNALVKALQAREMPPNSAVVSSANGTDIDLAEADAIGRTFPEAPSYSPKAALGESVGASGLWQLIVARQALLEQKLPPLPGAGSSPLLLQTQAALVISCGLNQGFAVAELGL